MKWWTKFWLNPYFGIMVLAAFGSFISFIHSGSYSAEVKNQQTLWTVVGGVLAIIAVLALIKSWKTSRTGDS